MTSDLSDVVKPLIGIGSLAVGADQIFAETVLSRGGALHVVLPFEDYERTFDLGEARDSYQDLLRRAACVEILPVRGNDEESYMAAGRRVVDLADRMIAVWNGRKAAGLGGTGDVVAYALAAGKEVLHINPTLQTVERLRS